MKCYNLICTKPVKKPSNTYYHLHLSKGERAGKSRLENILEIRKMVIFFEVKTPFTISSLTVGPITGIESGQGTSEKLRIFPTFLIILEYQEHYPVSD